MATERFLGVPQFNQHMQENQLYRKVYTYLNSLPCIEDSDFANLFSGNKSSDISLVLDSNQTISDTFLSARVYWTNENKTLALKIRRKDKRRILRPYIQHIHRVFDEIEQRRKEVKLYINADNEPQKNGRWISVPFTHPATIETAVMDSNLKSKVKSDLETFLKSKQYYNRLGRVWKRSYLFLGPSGTGKSTFVAGMAKFLCYDIYDIDLSKIEDNSDLRMLLLQTTNKSMIVEEIFQTGASLSPAEIGEIMISNKSSPTRALKSVITALQSNGDVRGTRKVVGRQLTESSSSRGGEDSGESGMFCQESVHTVSEFRKLYGLFRMRSSRKESIDLDSAEREQ
ncbi:hypothetical protein LguiA_031779 [Lonicera macranthoides]